jgi:hypothetical protein
MAKASVVFASMSCLFSRCNWRLPIGFWIIKVAAGYQMASSFAVYFA